MFAEERQLVPDWNESGGERTGELDHVGLSVLAGVVDHSFGVGLDDRIYKLVSKGLSDIRSGPKQADYDDGNGQVKRRQKR